MRLAVPALLGVALLLPIAIGEGHETSDVLTFKAPARAFVGKAKIRRTTKRRREDLLQEDEQYWKRFLDAANSIETKAPAVPPTPAPESTPTPTKSPSEAPCPVKVEITCISEEKDECQDISPPGEDGECIVMVDYTYTFTNDGDEAERVYVFNVTRNGVEKDMTDLIPSGTDIAPGETISVTEMVAIDICDEDSSFTTEAKVVTGPPCDVAVKIFCISEDGDECKEIPAPEVVEDCLIDVSYSYKVDNIGDIDANIIFFTRDRDGEIRDIMPLLDTTFLAVGDSTTVQEADDIDLCSGEKFNTKVIVRQVPNADLLCEDFGFYPL